MNIIGIDPGLHNTGWAVLDGAKSVVGKGCISTSTAHSIGSRLAHINAMISEVLHEYRPQSAGIEEIYVAKGRENYASSIKLSYAKAVILMSLAENNIPTSEYKSKTIKKSVAGTGNASKEEIEKMLKYMYPNMEIKRHDIADAIAIALCHSYYI